MSEMYNLAKSEYAKYGIDTESIINKLANKSVSVHCWQGDDVLGFDQKGGLSGGIQTTGNYPGRARNFEELKADFEKAMSLAPGKKRINLHASYAVFTDENPWVDRDKLEFKHFKPWVDWARQQGIGIDFNPTVFGHPMMNNELSLSSPDKKTRDFWIAHCIACRNIAEEIGKELDDKVLVNVWIPDGFKDIPADRLGPRKRLEDSLNQIFAQKLDHVIDCVESKVFGIGLESMTVGSNEFYMAYAAKQEGVYNLIDNGHYHPLENAADKISAIMPFFDKIPLHITRSVRWDSDHVCIFDDTLKDICAEITKTDEAWEKVIVALDFFDASINRVGAWTTGVRAAQKALLFGLLQPNKELTKMQDEYKFTEKMMTFEAFKSMPFGAVWDEYCSSQNVPNDLDCYKYVKDYEDQVLSKRN